VVGAQQWSPSFGGEPVVSYSQNAEDVRLWRVFGAIEDGFYVDVGAADPNVDSVTRLFYEHGWSGINIEPNPCFDALRDARTRDVNLRIAIGESEGSVPFFLTYPYLGMSTLDLSVHAGVPETIERFEEVVIEQRRLDSVLEEHAAGRTIHFLKIDVEGAEGQVLASSDWSSFRPIVVIAEAIESLSTTPTHEGWETVLLDAGYLFAAFDGINRFYVDRAHDDLIPALAYPMSALDRFVTARAEGSGDLRHSLDVARAELVEARETLAAIYSSPTWRAGRVVARALRPVRAAGKRVRRLPAK
jgi:FkbM family methyltransferase